MATIEDIKKRAALVKNATEVGENTATRVGGVLVDLANQTEEIKTTKADTSTVNSLQSQVSTNTSDITDLGSSMGTMEGDISSLKTDVAKKADNALTTPNVSLPTEQEGTEELVMGGNTTLPSVAQGNYTRSLTNERNIELMQTQVTANTDAIKIIANKPTDNSLRNDLASKTTSGASLVGYKGIAVQLETEQDGTAEMQTAQPKTLEAELDDLHTKAYQTERNLELEQAARKAADTAMQNNIPTITQTAGTATDKVMSQKAVTDYVNQRLMDSAQSHSTFGSGFCYKLTARQIELLEASDVITLEICAQCSGGFNSYNNTAALRYFGINFGNNHARFKTTFDGAYAFTGDSKLNPNSGDGWKLAATQTGVEPRMPNDRVLMVIDRKQGIVRLYDKCSRKIIECQRDAYKCDSWLQGDDWLAIMTGAPTYVADLWAIRIYDRDVEPMKYNGDIWVNDSNFAEAILPFQYPSNAKAVQVQDYAFMYKNTGAPNMWPKTRAYDSADGLLTGTNDTTDWMMVGATDSDGVSIPHMFVREVDFEVTGGTWRVVSLYRIHVYSCVNAEGTDMGINGYYERSKTSAEMPAGRYTMKFVSELVSPFADIAAGATIKHYGAKIHTLHCVANINPRYYCNMQCWDDARQEWWTPLDVKNHSTPVVPTFSDAAWRSVPAPALLSQPSFNGQLKVGDSGKVYVGVVVGATRTWKQINNT